MTNTTDTINTRQLLNSFEEATSQLIDSLSLFTEKEINMIPFEGSWTAAQVGEHLLKSGKGIINVLNGKTEPTKRNPLEQVVMIESIFLDFTKKAQSAKSLWPSEEDKNKKELISALQSIMEELKKTASEKDITLTCVDYPFPTLGNFTRYEWMVFVICHTKKHTHQIDNIHRSISN